MKWVAAQIAYPNRNPLGSRTRRDAIRILTYGSALAAVALAFYALLHTQQSASAATSSQTGETPATVDPGPGTAYLDPVLWGILQKQSAGQSAPANVTLSLDVFLDVPMTQALAQHVAADAASATRNGKNPPPGQWKSSSAPMCSTS